MKNSGHIDLSAGYKFGWLLENNEIYGWTEKPDGGILSKSGGWFGTNDPLKASRIAQSNLDFVLRST